MEDYATMNEATLRNYVRPRLLGRGVLTTHHEDALNVGIPDLSYSGNGVNGWIELKWLPFWPVRADTIVRIPHYTKEQKHFLLTRGRAGGRCWLLLRVGKEHLLFNYLNTQYVGAVTREELRARSEFFPITERIDFDQLTEILTK